LKIKEQKGIWDQIEGRELEGVISNYTDKRHTLKYNEEKLRGEWTKWQEPRPLLKSPNKPLKEMTP
jgi:hypothetical protein